MMMAEMEEEEVLPQDPAVEQEAPAVEQEVAVEEQVIVPAVPSEPKKSNNGGKRRGPKKKGNGNKPSESNETKEI